MRILEGMLLGLLATAVLAGPTYKWVDEQGQVHYSDRPHPGAEEIQLGAPTTFTPPPELTAVRTQRPPAEPSASALDDTGSRESAIQVVSPGEDQVLWNIQGRLPVAVTVQPRLQPGHKVNLYLDGNRVLDGPPGRVAFELEEVWRGTHTLYAAIEGLDGGEFLRSQPVTFHVQQTSVLRPKPP